ncbi:MAG: flagellar assembly protein FliH [Hyphomicrobiaceae bacterium]|nr:flagellar assembly protein FliH [Hyphomicrobiaceae bacterium]
MAAPARFLFDRDFAAPPPPPPAPPAPPVPEVPRIDVAEHETILAAMSAVARQDGFDEGYRAGRAAAEARAAERIAEEAARLAASARSILAVLDQDRLRIEREAIDVALLAARKLAPALIAREPLAEITELLRECLRPLARTPHLVVRLTPEHVEALRPALDDYARQTGFSGRLMLIGEPDIAVGDCRIEWTDGGITRDRAAVEAEIVAAISRYMDARAGELADAGRED